MNDAGMILAVMAGVLVGIGGALLLLAGKKMLPRKEKGLQAKLSGELLPKKKAPGSRDWRRDWNRQSRKMEFCWQNCPSWRPGLRMNAGMLRKK
jgi:hypothetical protein